MCVLLPSLICSGSGGNRSGLHRLHRGHHEDARRSSVVRAVLHHALLSGIVHHVRQRRGSRGAAAGSEHLTEALAEGGLHRYGHSNDKI